MMIDSNVRIDIHVICDKLYGFRKDGKGARPKSRLSFMSRFDTETPLVKDVMIELFNITAKTRVAVLDYLLELITDELCKVAKPQEVEEVVEVKEEFEADKYRKTHAVEGIGTRELSSWDSTKYTAVDFPKLTKQEEAEYNAILDEYLPKMSEEIGIKQFYGYRDITREDIWENMKRSKYVSNCGYEKTFQASRSYEMVTGTDDLDIRRTLKIKYDDVDTCEPYIRYKEFCEKVKPYRLKMLGLYEEKAKPTVRVTRMLESDYETAVKCTRPRQLDGLKKGFKRDKKIYGKDEALKIYLKKLGELKTYWDAVEVVSIAGNVVMEAKIRSRQPGQVDTIDSLLEDIGY